MHKTLRITGNRETDLQIRTLYRRKVANLPLRANGQPHTGFRLDREGRFHYTHLQVLQEATTHVLEARMSTTHVLEARKLSATP